MHEIAEKTIKILLEKKIQIRDTIFPYYVKMNRHVNVDNFYKNGRKYNYDDPFKSDVVYDENLMFGGISGAKGYKAYQVANCKSIAFDLSPIVLHPRYFGNNGSHVIAHELVHKLQHVTMQEENQYINFNGKNWNEYISQRTELEAHYVQCIYIIRSDNQWFQNFVSIHFPNDPTKIIKKIEELSKYPFTYDLAKDLLQLFADLKLIGPNAIKPSEINIEETQPFSITFTAEEYIQLINKCN